METIIRDIDGREVVCMNRNKLKISFSRYGNSDTLTQRFPSGKGFELVRMNTCLYKGIYFATMTFDMYFLKKTSSDESIEEIKTSMETMLRFIKENIEFILYEKEEKEMDKSIKNLLCSYYFDSLKKEIRGLFTFKLF